MKKQIILTVLAMVILVVQYCLGEPLSLSTLLMVSSVFVYWIATVGSLNRK